MVRSQAFARSKKKVQQRMEQIAQGLEHVTSLSLCRINVVRVAALVAQTVACMFVQEVTGRSMHRRTVQPVAFSIGSHVGR
jgi:hypothetical protein